MANWTRTKLILWEKHYDYPDLSSGYQRTSVPIGYEGELNGIRIKEKYIWKKIQDNINLTEEQLTSTDQGNSINRNWTEPDIKSPEEARNFLKELIRVLQYSKGARGEGTMSRCKCFHQRRKQSWNENINSIKGAFKALKFEVVRQKNHKKRYRIKQETRAT